MEDSYLEAIKRNYGKDFEIIHDIGQKIISKHGLSEKVNYEVAVFKPNWDFLRNGLQNAKFEKEDHTLIDSPTLYRMGEKRFVARGTTEYAIQCHDCWPKILNCFTRQSFKHAKCEDIVGFLAGSSDTGIEGLAIHAYSGGLELSSISFDTPETFRQRVASVAVHALAEFHERGIDFMIPAPTNMRYDLDSRIFFEPHQDIQISQYSISGTQDLATLLLLNPWMTERDSVIAEYAHARKFSEGESARFNSDVKKQMQEDLLDPDSNVNTDAWWRAIN